MGQVLEQNGFKVKVVVKEAGKDGPKEGDIVNFHVGAALVESTGGIRSLEQHGRPTTKLGEWIRSTRQVVNA